MRIVYPTVTNMGLGNNLITLAKAYLISEACQMTYQPPIWPSNIHVWPPTNNGYGYYFPATAGDKFRLGIFSNLARIQKRLSIRLGPPSLTFRREDYENYCRADLMDVGNACLAFLKSQGLDDPSSSVTL